MTLALKVPLAQTLDNWHDKKTNAAFNLQGKSLPATVAAIDGSIVTVNFEVTSPFTLPQVKCPLFGPEYIRYPVRVGDKGFVVAADARLGGVSGLGGGTADLSQPSNLGALVFFPIGNAKFYPVDATALVLYSVRASCSMTIAPSGVSITGTAASLESDGNVVGNNGASGSFATGTGQMITVQDGIITNIY
jgi:hypothetical protein